MAPGHGENWFWAKMGIDPDGKLAWFVCFRGTNGLNPDAGITKGQDGNFYGTTYGGNYRDTNLPTQNGFNYGTIFRVTPSGVLTTLVAFENTNGACPIGKMVLAKDGNFYGTTKYCNSYGLFADEDVLGSGAIYKMTPDGKLSVVVTLDSVNKNRVGGLVEGIDGNLYGMSAVSVFKIDIKNANSTANAHTSQ